jgi:hypothetical protein
MRRVWFLLACVIAALPAAVFLWQDGFFASSDGMIHLYRLFELDRSLRAGILYPRWFPMSGYGYGLPVLNYYPPLAYYLGELFHLAGAGYIASIKLLIAAGFLIALISMFFFARDLLGNRAAFVAGVAYAYLPYLLSDAYVRGNFPEFLAMSLLPLALWAFHRKDEGRRQKDDNEHSTFVLHPSSFIFLPSVVFAAIILVHHLTALLFAALLLAYLGFLFWLHRDARAVLRSGFAILLALALSAFYWLPALAELDLVYVGPASIARFIVNRLVSPADFFAPALAYTYLPQSEALTHVPGFPQTMLALLSLVVVLVASFRSRNTHHATRNTYHAPRLTFYVSRFTFHVLFFFVLAALALAMSLDLSAPLWYAFPPLRFMQFPWRFQVLAGVGIAFLLGVWAKWLAQVLRRFDVSASVAPTFSVALIVLGILNLPVRALPLNDADVNLLRANDSDYVIAQMGWGWTREFVPATVKDLAIYAPIAKPNLAPSEPAAALPSIQIQRDDLLSTALRVSTAQPFELSLHTFFFPGWQAYIDGALARTYPRGDLGLASVTVPPGDHAVAFRFEDTPVRAAANLISLIAFVGLLVGLLIARRRVFVAAVIVLAVVAAALALNVRADARPQPVSADLERQAMLIGYANERAGETLYVTLYWLALQEMGQDYTSFVHLIAVNDNVLAQHDGPPDQGLTPTTRWLPGEIVADRHAISLQGVAPGEYRLEAGMYLARENGYQGLGNPIGLGRIQK